MLQRNTWLLHRLPRGELADLHTDYLRVWLVFKHTYKSYCRFIAITILPTPGWRESGGVPASAQESPLSILAVD